MSTIKKATLAILALGAGLAAAPALYAQDTSGSVAPKAPGMMDHSGMMGGDMGARMKMMENCNRMMQSMNNPSPQTLPRETLPSTPGQKG